MHVMMKIFSAISLVLCTGASQAALMNFTLTGTVIFPGTYNGNSFNLSGQSGQNTITVTGIFDDSAIPGGTGTVLFNSANSGNTFSIFAGAYSATNSEDDSYLLVYPSLELSNYSLVSFDFEDYDAFNAEGFFNSYDTFFQGADENFLSVSGTWTDISITAVPVPAAVWLLGSGLLGLVGVARRKTAA